MEVKSIGYNPPMKEANFSVVITGEWPGVGQSTTAKLLAERLNFERVYAGHLFRKFAHIWNIEKKNLTWSDFESQVASGQFKLDQYDFSETDFNEYALHQWQHQLKKVDTPALWDKIVDQQSLAALQKPGYVVEAKVGVLLDKTGLIKEFKADHTIFKFLLTCPPEISTHRIIRRKIDNGELPEMDSHDEEYLELVRQTTTETIDRHLRDWERYEKIYGILRSDIYDDDIVQIDTSHFTPEEVVQTILTEIKQRL